MTQDFAKLMRQKLEDQQSFGPMGAAPTGSLATAPGSSTAGFAGGAASGSASSESSAAAAARDLPMFVWSGVWGQLVQFCNTLLAARTNGTLLEGDRVR